jgi:PKD repeat protein
MRRGTTGHASRHKSRGQSLVEFALVLPVMLVLLLIALDFGRVYLGYINLQTMSRIAANFAANNPDAWDAAPDAAAQTKYRNQVLADAAANNCVLPRDAGGNQIVPRPTFTDTNSDGKTDTLGDTVQVALTCRFTVITPVISAIVGSQVAVSAQTSFPVKAGMSDIAPAGGGGGGGGGGSAPSAAFTANGTQAGSLVTVTGTLPFVVDFRDTSGGSPTSWIWDLGGGTTAAPTSQQDQLGVTFSSLGKYSVSLQAINPNGSSTASITIQVNPAGTADFTANPTSITAGQSVAFTATASSGATNYSWNFGDGTAVQSGAALTNVNHTYSSSGGSPYAVTLTVTFSSGSPAVVTKTNLITVAAPLCVVPTLSGQKIGTETDASGKWAKAGFDYHNLSVGPGSPNANPKSNWTIASQSIVANSSVPCTATIQVNDH